MHTTIWPRLEKAAYAFAITAVLAYLALSACYIFSLPAAPEQQTLFYLKNNGSGGRDSIQVTLPARPGSSPMVGRMKRAGISVAGGLVLVAGMAALFFLLSWLWRKHRTVRVFISYQAGLQDKAQQVEALLKQHKLKVNIVPFDEQARHDEVLERVRTQLKGADAMVVIPHHEHPSFVNAEIWGAVILGLPVVFLKYQQEQRLPDTGFSGFPVFRYDKVVREKGKPLADYFFFACHHRRDYRHVFFNHLSDFWQSLREVASETAGALSLGSLLLFAAAFAAAWYNVNIPRANAILYFAMAILLIASAGWMFLVLLGICLNFVNVRKKADIARQRVVTGEATFESLQELLAGHDAARGILGAIDPRGLRNVHG